jgi:small neutral amino acid transporter SnatA (MarC family)
VTSSFATLALVIDPIGLAPAFIAITQGFDATQFVVDGVKGAFHWMA